MMPYLYSAVSRCDVDKSDYVHFVNLFDYTVPSLRTLRDSMRTLTGLSGEYVTFDQNVKMQSMQNSNF